MPHSRYTLTLGSNWDLTLTGTGKIATTQGPLATAQNVANEVRMFLRDAYFQQDRGIPHFNLELGHPLPDSAFRSYVRIATLYVDDVETIVELKIDDFDRDTRLLSGDIRFITVEGENVEFTF